MNAEGLLSAGGLWKKIISFLVFCTVDLSISCYIVFIDMGDSLASENSENAPFSSEKGNALIMTAVQFILRFCLIFWYFFLIWKTFMFRFGLIKKLLREFPILYLAPLDFLVFTIERALRYVSKL